jgi:hypothetical protein
MEEQIKQPQESVSGEKVDDGIDYISAINEIKQKSVSREAYEKVKSENKELLDALINGGQVEATENIDKKSIDDLRKELYSQSSIDKGMLNIDYIAKTLELRDSIIEKGGIDPFLPVGKGVPITREDVEQAELAAQVFKECLEFANGNNEVFTNELMRRTVDTGLPKRQTNNYYRR